MPTTHYSSDGEQPLCHCNLIEDENQSGILCAKVPLVDCDLCLYLYWRTINKEDILAHLDKCGVTVFLWPDDEAVDVSCDIPELLHFDDPADKRVHWNNSMGWWVGSEVEPFVFSK